MERLNQFPELFEEQRLRCSAPSWARLRSVGRSALIADLLDRMATDAVDTVLFRRLTRPEYRRRRQDRRALHQRGLVPRLGGRGRARLARETLTAEERAV